MPVKPIKKFRVLLLVDLNCITGRTLLKGISQYVQEFNNWEITMNLSYLDKDHRNSSQIRKDRFDGIIAFTVEKKMLTKVLRSGLPAIVRGVYKPVPGYINFYIDNMMVCKKAYDHFRHLGFERFAYCGLDSLYWSRERREALRNITATDGYQLIAYPRPRSQKLRMWKNEKAILAKWLESLPKPIGLLVATDFRGREVLEACQYARIAVPEEIAVLSVDDDDCICPFTNPPLSSIGRFFHKAGYEAALALNDLMSGKTPKNHEIIIEPQDVTQRQSTNILAVENPTIAKALLFIRSEKNKILTIEQVAGHVAVHSRVLYNLFKKHLGHTVHEEIQRVRTDEISRLLLETDMTVSEIAGEMGFQDAANFARYFRKTKGMSPSDFRTHYKP
ncbi:MAG: XylR family transcriptional regulator [Planctomycetes bacterium]|nr:XylR family transcriptional regulator [Planctomycetota bacterium]